MSFVAKIGVRPQGPSSNTDQLYYRILKNHPLPRASVSLFITSSLERIFVLYIFQISAVQFISFPCSLSPGYVGLCAVSRTFQEHTSGLLCWLSFSQIARWLSPRAFHSSLIILLVITDTPPQLPGASCLFFLFYFSPQQLPPSNTLCHLLT